MYRNGKKFHVWRGRLCDNLAVESKASGWFVERFDGERDCVCCGVKTQREALAELEIYLAALEGGK